MPTGIFVGLTTLDVTQLVDGLPDPNGKTTARRSWMSAGGPGATAAIAFAALGGRARLVTAIGGGPAAEVVRADLATAGVEVLDAAPAGFSLAASVALVNARTGERAVVSGSGHRPDRLQRLEIDLADADVMLLDGHHGELATAAAQAAAVAGVPVVVDAGSHKPVFDELWPVVTDVICSEDYRGAGPQALLAAGVTLVAISHGAGPVQWWTPEGAGEAAVPPVDAVDTLGAGDVLHGGYAWALATGRGRLAALDFGIAAAARRVACLGPFGWRSVVAELVGRLPGQPSGPGPAHISGPVGSP